MQIVHFGAETDTPLAADYTGDGKADYAVFRNGTWYIKRSDASEAEFDTMQFGAANDIPLKGDFDGDGKTDIAVYRSGVWHIQPAAAAYRATQFGLPTDTPLAR